MSERPYSRHYHDLIDDTKFAEVFPDDHHYACWSRLLMIADQAWPASAHIPITARKASIQKLADVGLIDLLPDGRFRMHGLQAERERRSSAAAHAATARWGNAPRSADGNADRIAGASDTRMPRKEEKRQEETSTPRASAGDVPTDPADAYWTLTGRYPQDKTLRWIDDLIVAYGQAEVTRRLVEAFKADPTVATLLGRVADLLKRDARALDLSERNAEKRRVEEHRRPVVIRRPEPEISDEEAERIAREYRAAARGNA